MPGQGDHFKMSCQLWTQRVWNVGSSGSRMLHRNAGKQEKYNKVKRWKQGEINKRAEERKKERVEERREVERSTETERETDIQKFPFTYCLPWVIPPLSPENGALCLAVSELTFTACLLLLWLFSPPGVIASLQSLCNNAASKLREWGMQGRIRPGQTFNWHTMTGSCFWIEGKKVAEPWMAACHLVGQKWPLRGIVTPVEFMRVSK